MERIALTTLGDLVMKIRPDSFKFPTQHNGVFSNLRLIVCFPQLFLFRMCRYLYQTHPRHTAPRANPTAVVPVPESTTI